MGNDPFAKVEMRADGFSAGFPAGNPNVEGMMYGDELSHDSSDDGLLAQRVDVNAHVIAGNMEDANNQNP